ncbi:16175_t:CDS:2, partial [Dentiscutata erythropus]
MASKVLPNFIPSYLNNTPIGEYNKAYLNKTPIGEYNKKNELQPICVPTVLNKDDAEIWLDVCSNGLKVVYNGPGRLNVHAAAIRANYPMPIEAGLYYFEVDIIDKGEFG